MNSSEANPGFVERLGRRTANSVEEFGFGAALLGEASYWIALGHWRRQPVRLDAVMVQMVEIGILAIPIVSILSAAIGAMLAIQGIDTLRTFGAESQVVIGIEFLPAKTQFATNCPGKTLFFIDSMAVVNKNIV